MLGCSPLPRARATRGARVTCEVPWKSGASAPRQAAFETGFSPVRDPRRPPGLKPISLHSSRGLEGPLFHGRANGRKGFQIGSRHLGANPLILPWNFSLQSI